MRQSGCVRGQQHLRVRSTGGAVAGECWCEPVLSPQSPGWHSHPTVHNNALLCSIYTTRTLHPAREKLVVGTGHVMAVEQTKRRVSQAHARWKVRVVMGVRGGWCRSLPWARKSSADDCTLLSSAPLTHTLTHSSHGAVLTLVIREATTNKAKRNGNMACLCDKCGDPNERAYAYWLGKAMRVWDSARPQPLQNTPLPTLLLGHLCLTFQELVHARQHTARLRLASRSLRSGRCRSHGTTTPPPTTVAPRSLDQSVISQLMTLSVLATTS